MSVTESVILGGESDRAGQLSVITNAADQEGGEGPEKGSCRVAIQGLPGAMKVRERVAGATQKHRATPIVLSTDDEALLAGRRIVVVMPAYNAARTLQLTWQQIPKRWVQKVVLVDDSSTDQTVELARSLPIEVIAHPHNVGYGGNQKTCYLEALRQGADVVVMLHPDGQYDPTLIPELVRPVLRGDSDMVLGSRFLHGTARKGGMPLYKFVANRSLTTIENLALRGRFSELHTGYRAYSRRFLETIPFLRNSNDFVFDTEVIAQAMAFHFRVAEVPVATRYFPQASSATFRQSIVYGLKTLNTMRKFILWRYRVRSSRLFRR